MSRSADLVLRGLACLLLGSALGVSPLVAAPPADRSRAQVLPDALRLLDVPSYENTVAVVPPGPRAPRGAVVVVTGGYARGTKILVRPLLDAKRGFDGKSRTREVDFPQGPTVSVGTDNQIVRLADGTLLAEKDAFVWSPITPPPAWKDELVTGRTERRPQQRGSPVFFASRDEGSTWTLASVLDLAVLCDGRYGIPRPMTAAGAADVPVEQQGVDGKGKRYWWVGGADRTEVYACPFTGIVWCTTRVISGPYGTLGPQRNTTLLARSADDGRTWEIVKEDLPAWSPSVMTSTSDGRLFLFQSIGESPILWWSAEPTTKTGPVRIAGGVPTSYVEDGKPVPCRGDASVDLEIKLAAPTIARLPPDGTRSRVRVAYQGANAAGRQTACVVDVSVEDPAGPPRLSNVARIGAARADASVMYFTFVQPGPDAPEAARKGAHVLYWIDATSKEAPTRAYAARFALFDEHGLVGEPGTLSVRGGAPRSWATRQDPGDYLDGAFFEKDGRGCFFCVWPEPDGLWANVVQTGNP
jgi:hypothetical protein